ncbi:MAG: cellulose synthase regulator protein [Hyphomicrobiales bacterium]|nr:cellulose synthase regulator protein [Hyphomicrobiales bacterium]
MCVSRPNLFLCALALAGFAATAAAQPVPSASQRMDMRPSAPAAPAGAFSSAPMTAGAPLLNGAPAGTVPMAPAPLAGRPAAPPASAPASVFSRPTTSPAGTSGSVLRHLTNNIQGFRLTGEIGQSEWPMYLTEAQAQNRLVFKIGYLAAISVMPEASYLTLAINDVVVGRTNIVGTRGVRAASFDIPQGLMKPGFNAIRISAEQRHRVDCSVQATYELWTQIDPTQTGLLLPRSDPGALTLADLAALPVDEQGALPIRAITPARASMGSVERIVRATQMISLAGRFAQPVVDFGAMANGDYGLNLAIGPISDIASQIEPVAIGPVTGPRVVIVPASGGRRTTIVATGRNADEVEAALQQFTLEAANRGSPEGLRAAAAFPGFRMMGGERVKLRDLGLVSQEFSGRLFRAAFNVILPPDFYSADYGKAELDVAGGYAPGLGANSQIVVSVNGRNAVSFKLARKAGEVFKRNPMPLPLGLMRPGLNRIEIEAHLPAATDSSCDPLAAISGSKRFLFLDATEIEMPRIARIARMPDLAVTATGAFPYGEAKMRPSLVVLGATRETVGAAATLATHLAIAAGAPIDFRLSVSMPEQNEGPTLIVAPAPALDSAVLRSVGLKQDDLAKIWRERMDNPAPAAPETLPRSELLARHRLVLQRNFPAACHMPTPQGGFRKAERMAAVRSLAAQDTTAQTKGAESRDLYNEWDSDLRSQSGLLARAQAYVNGAVNGVSAYVSGARLWVTGQMEPPIERPALTQQASLIVAQSLEGDSARGVRTLVTAPDAVSLSQSVACLVDPRVWRQIAGRIAVLNGSDGQVVDVPVDVSRLIMTQPLSVQNSRLIMAGWLSLNSKIFVALALLMAAILAFTTTVFVRNVGRKQQ